MCRYFEIIGWIYLLFIRQALFPAAAQPKLVEFGQLDLVKAHATWPAPESIVRDLRSSNEDIRLKALGLAGVPDALRHRTVYSDSTPAVGSEVVRPTQFELRYAALGSDETQQAVLAVQVGQYGFATVATPRGNGWERVGQFNCWCKYDVDHFLDEFLSVRQAPNVERFELVLRASGGGSGLYNQDEVHFRFHRGEMKPVVHFVSRRVNFHMGIPKPYLEIERRWFQAGHQYGAGGVLVEGHADLPPDGFPPIEVSTYEASVRALESRHLGRLTCRAYSWNDKTFQYEPSMGANPCKAPNPEVH